MLILLLSCAHVFHFYVFVNDFKYIAKISLAIINSNILQQWRQTNKEVV